MNMRLLSIIEDVLAFQGVSKTNPKYNNPITGYVRFSDEQKEFLRKPYQKLAFEICMGLIGLPLGEWLDLMLEKAYDEGQASGRSEPWRNYAEMNPYRSKS